MYKLLILIWNIRMHKYISTSRYIGRFIILSFISFVRMLFDSKFSFINTRMNSTFTCKWSIVFLFAHNTLRIITFLPFYHYSVRFYKMNCAYTSPLYFLRVLLLHLTFKPSFGIFFLEHCPNKSVLVCTFSFEVSGTGTPSVKEMWQHLFNWWSTSVHLH